MANRTRNIVLRVPVTAEERAMIERKMQQMGTGCFSVYARKMLIDGYVIRLDYSDVKAMTAELQKIGTNINQIAKRVNAKAVVQIAAHRPSHNGNGTKPPIFSAANGKLVSGDGLVVAVMLPHKLVRLRKRNRDQRQHSRPP